MNVFERVGRYVLYPPIAAGGMATVHTARIASAEGIHRLVAAKRLHPQLSEDPEFVSMFNDEARIASRIHHPNVVRVLDVVTSGSELILVQEYVHGVPLSHLLKQSIADEDPIPIHIAVAIISGALAGLHAAHEVKDDDGKPLDIIHRDVSPQNILVSIDGVPRLLDFGIAKARTSTHHTREGVFKGKLAYIAPEQLKMEPIDRTSDIYSMGVLLWELLVNRRIFDGRHELGFVTAVMCGELPRVMAALGGTRETVPDVRLEALGTLDPIVAKAMAPEPRDRFPTAEAMLRAIAETDVPSASVREVAAWVKRAGEDYLERRERTLAENEGTWRTTSVRATTVARGTLAQPAQHTQPAQPAQHTQPTQPAPRAQPARRPPLPRPSPPPLRIPSPLPKPSPLAPLAITQPPPPPPALTPSISPLKILDVAPPSLSPIVASRVPAALDEPPFSDVPFDDRPAPRAVVRRRCAGDLSRIVPWAIVGVLFIVTGAVAGITTVSRPTPLPPAAAAAPAIGSSPPTPVLSDPPPPVIQLPAPVPTTAPVVVVTTTRPHPAAPSPPPPPAAPLAPRYVPPSPAPAKPSAGVDCNPPFFYEGTRKVFKPACF